MTPPAERWRRLLCRLLGHRVLVETRAEPVARFNLCIRCGRYWR